MTFFYECNFCCRNFDPYFILNLLAISLYINPGICVVYTSSSKPMYTHLLSRLFTLLLRFIHTLYPFVSITKCCHRSYLTNHRTDTHAHLLFAYLSCNLFSVLHTCPTLYLALLTSLPAPFTCCFAGSQGHLTTHLSAGV